MSETISISRSQEQKKILLERNETNRLKINPSMKYRGISIIGSDDYRWRVVSILKSLALKTNRGFELVMNALGNKKELVIAEVNRDEIINGNQVISGQIGNNILNKNSKIYDIDVCFFFIDNLYKYSDKQNGNKGTPIRRTGEISLSHEIAHHLYNCKFNCIKTFLNDQVTVVPTVDYLAVENENIVRAELGYESRTDYRNHYIYGKSIKLYDTYQNKTSYWYGEIDKKNYAVPTQQYSLATRKKGINSIVAKEVAYTSIKVGIGKGGRLSDLLKKGYRNKRYIMYTDEKINGYIVRDMYKTTLKEEIKYFLAE